MDALAWMCNGVAGWIILGLTFAFGFMVGAAVAQGSRGEECWECALWRSWLEQRLESSCRE